MPGIFGQLGNNSVNDGHFVDDNGTVATVAQTELSREKEQEERETERVKDEIEEAFESVLPNSIAPQMSIAKTIIENSKATEEEKSLAKERLLEIADEGVELPTIDDLLTEISDKINALRIQARQQEDSDNRYAHAAGVLQNLYNSLFVEEKKTAKGGGSPIKGKKASSGAQLYRQLLEHLKKIGIPVHNKAEMDTFLKEHGYDSIQALLYPQYITNLLDESEKEEIRKVLLTVNHAGRGLVDGGNALYYVDHSDKEGIENRKKGQEGFQCIYKVSTDGLSKEQVEDLKQELTHGLIRTAAAANGLLENYNQRQDLNTGDNASSSLKGRHTRNVAVVEGTLESDHSNRERDDSSRPEDFGTGSVRTGFDGTYNSRYISIDDIAQDNYQEFRTPDGDLYGYVYNGEIWLDETKLSPNALIHEYTHLWDNALMKARPLLWARGKGLMKSLALWNQIATDDNYGVKWREQGKTKEEQEDLIASEIHARLTGENGEKLLQQIAEEQGDKSIIGKLKKWISDAWKALKATFSDWSQDEIDKLTLEDFTHMTVRDFVEGVNPNSIFTRPTGQSTAIGRGSISRREVNPNSARIQSMNIQGQQSLRVCSCVACHCRLLGVCGLVCVHIR